MRIGITGHQRLQKPSDWDWTRTEILKVLKRLPQPLIGVSSLAVGADQLFARIVLESSGELEAVIPFESYEKTFADDVDKDSYRRLLKSSSRVEVLPKSDSDEEGYLRAGMRVVDLCDLLIAVWDGKPAAGLGGTGDIVNYAHESNRNLIHLNPTGRKIVETVEPHDRL